MEIISRFQLNVDDSQMEGTQEHASWGYLWIRMQWKPRFIAVASGELKVYVSQHHDYLPERKLLLDSGVSVEIVDSQEYLSKSKLWPKLTRRSFSFEKLLEREGVVVCVFFSDGKRLSILVSDHDEAQTWKTEIEKACIAGKKLSGKTTPKLLLRLSSLKALASDRDLKSNFQSCFPWSFNNSVLESSTLETLHECTSFLKMQSSRHRLAFQLATNMLNRFNGSYQMGDCFTPNELRIQAWKETLLKIVRALREELVEEPLSQEQSENLWLACETWVMARAHDKILRACQEMFAAEDEELSNIQYKLREVDPSLLGLNASLKNLAFGEAIQTFGTINNYRTPLEKATCLKKTVNLVFRSQADRPCTDDLLSLMLLLIANSKVYDLQATACYLENFFQIHDQQSSGELRYHITNFVAACTHLSSPDIKQLLGSDIIIDSPSSSSAFSSPNSSTSSSSSSELRKLLDD